MSSHKRKRSASVFSSGSRSSQGRHLPSDSINPLSHSDSTIKQLRVAGLTEDDLLPSNYIPDFPHRPIRASLQDDEQDQQQQPDDDSPNSGSGEEEGADDAKKTRRRKQAARRMRGAQDQHLGFLTGVILRAIEEGDIPRAKRAFGLLRRSEVVGKPVDLRKNGLWSLGAEILMRDGEAKSRSVIPVEGSGGLHGDQEGRGNAGGEEEGGSNSKKAARRWGSAANMLQLRTYLESLIRQYPYNRLQPNSISDLDFYPVLFSCEFYNTWVEHKLALERLNEDSESWSDDLDIPAIDMPDYEEDMQAVDEYHQHHFTGRERRLRQEKANLGLRAMSTMRDIAARLDGLMENAPYSRSTEFLRLRGMVSLYIGDLSVQPPPRASDEEEEGNQVRQQEQAKARTFFVRMRQNGGQVDTYTEKWLGDRNAGQDDDYGEDEDDDDHGTQWSGLPVFSSLPVR
ncbi:hypothetical protein VM1G_04446 [Cytospora mali]|uniref:RNA polymerase I-specific transcription initiation factor rrn11 n=1 Tax=Cytospora mali TaxID=578113 RepID=A0A194VXL4_CYTMA|nr:hypothetical protein VM1G_04446 [Valsa mali]